MYSCQFVARSPSASAPACESKLLALPKYRSRQESGIPSVKVEPDRSERVSKPVCVFFGNDARPFGEAEAWSKWIAYAELGEAPAGNVIWSMPTTPVGPATPATVLSSQVAT